MKRVLLLDGSNLFYRAFYRSKQPMFIHAASTQHYLDAHVFIRMVLNIYTLVGRNCGVIVCWDATESAFRKYLYPEYKSNRPLRDADTAKRQAAARNILFELLPTLGMPSITLPDVEADDVIACFALRCASKHKIIIASNDRDLQQFPGSTIINADGDIIQVTAEHARRVLIEKIVRGDPSDNIKGIHGLGAKTFEKLYDEHNGNYLKILGALVEKHGAGIMPIIKLNRQLVNLKEASDNVIGPDHITILDRKLVDWGERYNTKLIIPALIKNRMRNLMADIKLLKEIGNETLNLGGFTFLQTVKRSPKHSIRV